MKYIFILGAKFLSRRLYQLGQEKEISWFSSSADPFFKSIKKKSSRNEDKEIEEKLGFNPVFEFLKSAQK